MSPDRLAAGIANSAAVSQRLHERLASAQERLRGVLQERAASARGAGVPAAANPWQWWQAWQAYATDAAQRSVLFWDTLRQRGNNFVAHERAGLPPVLHFAHETVLDGRHFERPVNYALLRILPDPGAVVDPKRRPYVIIDPRAGHGPGIGGFKDDSQVGVALRGGHPVYFVVFFPEPEPGQTLLDVCTAEARFVRRVHELHPESPKPVIVGNCQGGWAAMMLAASDPEHAGPIVINGAPMSYWGGSGRDGDADNPMRYGAGLAGGAWLASFAADLGNGHFDGAHLVQSFESLDPAASLWEKYYQLYANADTEGGRFLDFERWWGGYYLLNREEIEWITQNLFVGNKLAAGELQAKGGKLFDLREIRSPIVLFASLGDNITPPQQAFNWVADVYGSTEEIKARGQVIVGLLHENVGHLGIFVAGHVVRKEHTQIVSVLETIEALPPGIYGMEISGDEAHGFDVNFVEYALEDAVARLNLKQRADEKPFEAVAAASEMNQRAYERLAQPLVQAAVSDTTAELMRQFHPLRVSRWAVSDFNPWLWWLAPAAAAVKSVRAPLAPEAPLRRAEAFGSGMVSASLDYWRDVRDALTEAAFYQLYGPLLEAQSRGDGAQAQSRARRWRDRQPQEPQLVDQILERIATGGYAEALGRVAAMLRTAGEPIPLADVEARHAFAVQNLGLLPEIELADLRRVEGEQEIIVRYAPERALETLPALVREPADRQRLLTLIERAAAFQDSRGAWLNDEQRGLLKRIVVALAAPATRVRAAKV
jgi:pimeloyl-ACP methyl ester carboxylesterase